MNLQIVIGILLLLFIILLILAYNKAIVLRNFVREAFSTMDVYLKKRWDLIPNLLEITKVYAAHEKSVFEEITKLRSLNYANLDKNQKIDINQKLNIGITKLIASVENYPQLKANETYAKLMDELSLIEDDIANSRKYFNGTVRELNTYTELFPTNIVCALFGIKSEKMFEINDTQRESIKVEL